MSHMPHAKPETSIISSIMDFVSPRRCCVCGIRLSLTEKVICAKCNWHLPRTELAETPYDNPMARIFWKRLPLEKAAAWIDFLPKGEIAKIIYDIKYHHGSQMAITIGQMMAEELQEKKFFDDIDAIVPMPITLKRRWQRGYNQSEMIAEGISDITGLPVIKDSVKRTRFKGSQTTLGRMERLNNVEQVFMLKKPELISGKHVLLVDDIVTTGATLAACGEEIAKAGNMRISILTIGKTKG